MFPSYIDVITDILSSYGYMENLVTNNSTSNFNILQHFNFVSSYRHDE